MATSSSYTNGCVKWFNNKAGYGFITVNDCETNEPRDIFVHHSEIQVGESQYKYLVQGEYVEFMITPIEKKSDGMDVHATMIRGLNSGKLMCETRHDSRGQRMSYSSQHKSESKQRTTKRDTKSESTPRSQKETRRPQLDQADQSEWMIVPRRRTNTVASKRSQSRQPEIELQ